MSRIGLSLAAIAANPCFLCSLVCFVVAEAVISGLLGLPGFTTFAVPAKWPNATIQVLATFAAIKDARWASLLLIACCVVISVNQIRVRLSQVRVSLGETRVRFSQIRINFLFLSLGRFGRHGDKVSDSISVLVVLLLVQS
jgi:hypothetical protein